VRRSPRQHRGSPRVEVQILSSEDSEEEEGYNHRPKPDTSDEEGSAQGAGMEGVSDEGSTYDE
jgi:hypothetical protein